MKENPIYKFLKENNLTSKSEEDFLNEYSSEDKANELYSFFLDNKLTEKDFNSFYSEYLKKKDLGDISSKVSKPQEEIGVSTSNLENNQIFKDIQSGEVKPPEITLKDIVKPVERKIEPEYDQEKLGIRKRTEEENKALESVKRYQTAGIRDEKETNLMSRAVQNVEDAFLVESDVYQTTGIRMNQPFFGASLMGSFPNRLMSYYNELESIPENEITYDLVKSIADKHDIVINNSGSPLFQAHKTEIEKYSDAVAKEYERIRKDDDELNKDPFFNDMLDLINSGISNVGKNTTALLGDLGLNYIPGYNESVVQTYDYYTKAYQEQSSRQDLAIVDAAENGEYGKAVGNAVLQLSQSLPTLAMLAMGNAAGYENATLAVLGATEASGRYEDLRDSDMSDIAKVIDATIWGLAEALPEKFGTSAAMNKAFKTIKTEAQQEIFKKSLSDGLSAKFKKSTGDIVGYLNQGARGGIDEMATGMVQNALNGDELTKGLGDQFIVGFLTDAIVSTPELTSNLKQDAKTLASSIVKSIPKDMPLDSKVKAAELILEKKTKEVAQEEIDPSFKGTSPNDIENIDTAIKLTTLSKDDKYLANEVNKKVNEELAKENPDVEKLITLNSYLSGIEQKSGTVVDKNTQSVIDKAIKGNTPEEAIESIKTIQEKRTELYGRAFGDLDSKINSELGKQSQEKGKEMADKIKPIEQEKTKTEQVVAETKKVSQKESEIPKKEEVTKQKEDETQKENLQEKGQEVAPKKVELKTVKVKESGKMTREALGKTVETKDIISDGKKVGEVQAGMLDNNIRMNNIRLEPESQGKGIGKQSYKSLNEEANKRGGVLVSSETMSNQAKNVWESLVKEGSAIKNDNGSYSMINKNIEQNAKTFESGKVRIEGGQEKGKGISDKDMPIVDGTELQNREEVQKSKEKIDSALGDRLSRLTEKEKLLKESISDRLGKFASIKKIEGDSNTDLIKEAAGLIKDLGELGLIKLEKGARNVINDIKNYFDSDSHKFLDENIDSIESELSIKNPEWVKEKESELKEQVKEEGGLSGIKKALVPESKIEQTETDKRSIKEVMDEGKSRIESGVIRPRELIEEVIKSPRALQAEEVSAMIYYKRDLDNTFDSLSESIEKADKEGDYDTKSELNQAMNVVLIELDMFHEAALQTGYEQGLSFRMRQALLDSEYNITTQIRKYKAINNGYIPKEIEERFKQYDAELQKINRELRKLQQEKESNEANEVISNIKNDSKSISKKGKEIASKIRSAKLKNKGFTFTTVVPPKLIDGAIEIVAISVEKGSALIESIQNGLDYIKKSDWYKNLTTENRNKFEEKFKSHIIKTIKEDLVVEDKSGNIKISHNIIRDYIASGIDNINDLVKSIKEDFDLKSDERVIRDAVTKYGKTSELSKDEIEIEIRKIKRVGRLLSALEDVQEKQQRPKKSGLQRDKLSDEERRLQKQIKEAMKDIPVLEEDIKKSWKTALDAVKSRLRNQISDLEHQIETGEKTPKKKGIEYDSEANSLKQQRDDLKKIIEETEGKQNISDEQRIRIAIRNIENTISEYERRIKEKDFSAIGKPKEIPVTNELLEARKRLSELKDTYSKMKDSYGVTEKLRLDRLKNNLKKSISEYERRIKEKDFVPNKRAEKPKFDMEAARLEIERARIKHKYDVEIEKARLNARTTKEKLKDMAIDIFNLPKSLMASADFSAPLRQGAVLTFAYPKAGAKAFVDMFKQAFNHKYAEQWVEKLKSTDDYVLMKNSGLYLSEETAKLSAKEEQFMTNLAHKIPIWGKVVGASERAYTGYLNKLRSDTFKIGIDFLHGSGYNFKDSPEVFKAWADFINNATGRGKLGALEKSASVLNTAFFAPRLVASRINLMNPVKYYKMPRPVRIMAIRSMASFIGVTSTVLALSILAGFDVEDDPRSSDFGKIRIGDLRFDMWAGFQQPIRAISQFISGKTKSTSTGMIIDLDASKFPNRDRMDVILNFMRSKTSPSASLMLDIIHGETMLGDKLSAKRMALDRTIPLYLQDIRDVYKNEGLAITSSAALLSMFGVGAQYYKDSDSIRRSVNDGYSLDDAIDEFKKDKDNKVSSSQIKTAKKKYFVYKEYGTRDEIANMMLSPLTSTEKALLLYEKEKEGVDISKYDKSFYGSPLIPKSVWDEYYMIAETNKK